MDKRWLGLCGAVVFIGVVLIVTVGGWGPWKGSGGLNGPGQILQPDRVGGVVAALRQEIPSGAISGDGARSPVLLPLGITCVDHESLPVPQAEVSIDGVSIGATNVQGVVALGLVPPTPDGRQVFVEVAHGNYIAYADYHLMPLLGGTIQLSLVPRVNVLVVDDQGDPIRDAQCQLGASDASVLYTQGHTDENGELELRCSSLDSVGLRVSSPGFVDDWRILPIFGEEETLRIVMTSGRELAIKAVDLTGARLSGIDIVASLNRTSMSDSPVPPQAVTTGSDGVAIIGGLPRTLEVLELVARGPQFVSVVANFTLPAEDPLEPVEIQMIGAAGLRVRCVDSGGEPIVVVVSVIESVEWSIGSPDLPRNIRVDIGGVELSGIPSGLDFGLCAYLDGALVGWIEIPALAYGEVRDVTLSVMKLDALNLRMVDSAGIPVQGSFRARGTGELGLPQYPKNWVLYDRVDLWSSSVDCDSDGKAILHLPPGHFTVSARGPDRSITEKRELSTPISEEELFVVNAQPTRSGRLLDGEGQPLRRWGVRAFGHRGSPQKLVTDADGGFTVEGISGESVKLSAVHPCGVLIPVFNSASSAWPADGMFRVELHPVKFVVRDFRSGIRVPFRLSVRTRGLPASIGPNIRVHRPVSTSDDEIELLLPAGTWRFVFEPLASGSEEGGVEGVNTADYRVQAITQTVSEAQSIVALAENYVEPQFSADWQHGGASAVIQWSARSAYGSISGTLGYPLDPFSMSLVPLGELEFTIIRGDFSWDGSTAKRTVVVPATGVIPYK